MKVIVISGSMGSGKTTLLGECSDILTLEQVPHGTVDLDAIGTAAQGDGPLVGCQIRATLGAYPQVGGDPRAREHVERSVDVIGEAGNDFAAGEHPHRLRVAISCSKKLRSGGRLANRA